MRKLLLQRYFSLFGLAALMAFPLPAGPQEPIAEKPVDSPLTQCAIQNKSFRVGEEITYKIYYNWKFVWMDAGELTLKVEEKNGQYHMVAVGQTYSSYDWFYKVRDRYESYLDKKTLLPTLSIRNVHEGKYRLYDKITFNQEQRNAVSLRGKSQETAKATNYKLNNCMHDMLSVLYYCRNIDFDRIKAGQTFPVQIFVDKEEWPLQVKYKGKEQSKKIKGQGKFNTIKFSPEVIDGYVFDKGTEMDVWVSDDENRIPLLIESPLSVGKVKAVLSDYEGLRHELSSSLKKKKK